jgi:para-nitrobenzyl esterase
LQAQNETVAGYPRNFAFRSGVDDDFLPQSPQTMVAAGATRAIPLLIGSNRDEALLFFPPAVLAAEKYWIPAVRLAQAHAAAGGTTFMYRFDVSTRQGPFAGYAVHASEQPFTWHNFNEPFLEMIYGKSPVVPLFADTVHATWVQFIHSGKPAHRALPDWKRYDTTNRYTMLLDDSGCALAADPAGAERVLWDKLL